MHKSMLVALVLLAQPAAAATPAEVQITIQGISPGKGPVILSIYKDSETWLKKGKALEVKKLDGSGKDAIASLKLEPGTYALQAFQDENANDKLDMKWLPPGPGEPWVVSNNAQGSMGPPSFQDAKFVVGADMKVELTLQQP